MAIHQATDELSSPGEKNGLAEWALVVLLASMMGGLFPTIIILYSQNAVWAIWGLFWVFISILSLRIKVLESLRPISPFLIWMACFVAWGALVATYPIFDETYRLAFRFLSVAVSLSLVVSSRRRLRMFANGIQWALVGNLAVTLFLLKFPSYQGQGVFAKLSIEADSDRFAGLWGNANHAGLVSLLVLSLSRWATRWVALVGRISGLLIIYLTVSRTAFIISGCLLLAYLAYFAEGKERLRAALVGVCIVAVAGVYVGVVGERVARTSVTESPVVARVMDLSESRTRQKGQDSRLDLLLRWVPKVVSGPWYGYGLYSMGGQESKEIGFRPGFPRQGTHNIYMGILVDVGWVGLVTFLGIIGLQLRKIFRLRMPNEDRRSILALAFIICVFGFANHNLVTDYPGWIAFPLLFHLPSLLAIRSGDAPDSSGA
ncbi:MAG: O-antigen ligase family protein [Acidobacteria bacterium]|nr:O-antigen ligase family protein [Acidobacteriota bacterium]